MKSSTSTARGEKRPIFYGWWIVCAGFVSQAYVSGTFWQGFGAFFDPIVEQFGWSRAVTSGAVSLQRTESGMISPFVGYFINKFGPRKVMFLGMFATGLGFILLSRINNLWQFYAAFALLTVGLSFGSFLVVFTTVANWFVVRRSRALSLLSAGSGIGGLLVPVLVWLIATSDWRTALVFMGVGFWVVGLPTSLVMRRRPEDYGLLPDGASPDEPGGGGERGEDASEGPDGETSGVARIAGEYEFGVWDALATRSFWQMSLAMAGGQLVMSASVHQIPAMASFGISRTTAGLVILGVSLVGMVARIVSGYLGDYVDKRRIIAVAFVCQLIGTLIFAYISTTWHLFAFILFWGVGFGGSIPVRFAMIADYFGRRSFGSIMGTMMTVSTVFGVIGPVFVGGMFDLRGNYREPYLILSLAVLVSIPLILTLPRPAPRRRRA